MLTLGYILVLLAAVPATAFPIVYGITARRVWWRVPAGRALMVSTVALALLLDMALVFYLAPVSDSTRLGINVAVVGLIAVGAWLKFGALVHELHQGRKSVPPTP